MSHRQHPSPEQIRERCTMLAQQRDAWLEDAKREQAVYQREQAEADELYRKFDRGYWADVSESILKQYSKAYQIRARLAEAAEKRYRNAATEARNLGRVWRRLCGR